MKFHPCDAARPALKGTTPSGRYGRTGGLPGSGVSLRSVTGSFFGTLANSVVLGGHVTGMLRVEAVAMRRGPQAARRGSS